MGDLIPPDYLQRADGTRIAFRYRAARSDAQPSLVFLPGYASDMQGSKALALFDWAARAGRGCLLLDYSGCGESEGRFNDGTLAIWRDDALLAIERLVPGPVILIGSSMGGWIALLIARILKRQITGLIGVAAAPDFTDWGFSSAEKDIIERQGHLERPSDYGPEPMITTRGFWRSGQDNLLLSQEISIDCPVRLIHGQRDPDVPWENALRLAEQLRSEKVQVHLIKDGDHRLSRNADIALLLATVEALLKDTE
jgi:pimeloyl-ACP methyl ester carboxylesterase